jgi:hypothetical protein
LIRKVGGLFVATGLRAARVKEHPIWIITVTMRYPTGHEGNVGELLFDGENFTMLTEDSVIDERVDRIAADPSAVREWTFDRSGSDA